MTKDQISNLKPGILLKVIYDDENPLLEIIYNEIKLPTHNIENKTAYYWDGMSVLHLKRNTIILFVKINSIDTWTEPLIELICLYQNRFILINPKNVELAQPKIS